MKVNDLSFEGIVSCFNTVIATINDPRSESNAKKYTLREVILGAFAAFFMQNESFLEYQRPKYRTKVVWGRTLTQIEIGE
jgi:hypothetical protein